MKRSFIICCIFMFFAHFVNGQTQSYTGTVDGESIKASIRWNPDKTISGNYFFHSSPARIYMISGTNFIDGEIEVIETFNGRRTGTGTLYKTIQKGKIVWGGYISKVNGTNTYIVLTRAR